MFRVKICGVTDSDDARAAVAAGADAIGLNFFGRSKRFVEPVRAAEIVATVGAEVVKVGVFVNETAGAIQDVARTVRLDAVQLHGDEPTDVVKALADVQVVKAFRCSIDAIDDIIAYVAACQDAGRPLAGVLLDAAAGDQFGGTGQRADWMSARRVVGRLPNCHVILAGGLDARNVASAIAAVRPYGVDVAGGVESAPGRKDAKEMTRFVAAASRALAEP